MTTEEWKEIDLAKVGKKKAIFLHLYERLGSRDTVHRQSQVPGPV